MLIWLWQNVGENVASWGPPSFLLNILMLSSAHPTRQASQQFAEQGYMDQQQFRRIFDELDKDCIKEVDLELQTHSKQLSDNDLLRWLFIFSTFLLQHPPLPQYTSATLQKLQVVFSHYYLTVLGNLVALANVLCICVSSAHLCTHQHIHYHSR